MSRGVKSKTRETKKDLSERLLHMYMSWAKRDSTAFIDTNAHPIIELLLLFDDRIDTKPHPLRTGTLCCILRAEVELGCSDVKSASRPAWEARCQVTHMTNYPAL